MKLNRVRRRRRDLLKAAEEAEANRDRLSNLPDDVLLNIQERLDTLDALRTCFVSKQMLRVPAMLTRIDINIWPPSSSSRTTRARLFRANNAMADAANKILVSATPPHAMIAVLQLKLRFLLKRHVCLSIGKTVADAMATEKLAASAMEFEIFTENPWMNAPAEVLGVAKTFDAFLGSCPDAFAGLTRLRLENLSFLKESNFPNMLGACKRLRSLCLFRCDTTGVPSSSVLQVEHDGLVELEIAFGEFMKVELSCLPKLQRMTYAGWLYGENPLLLGFVPILSKLSVSLISTPDWHTTFEPSQLLANAPSVRDLHLDFASEKIWLLLEHPKLLAPLLGKLRLVNLDNLPEECDVAWTMFFLEAAPSLEELCITVWDHWCRRQQGYCEKTNVEWEPAADLKHKSLTKLTIYGFLSDDNFTGYVRRIMQAAVNLKEVSLHDRKACERCAEDGDMVRPSSYPRTREEKDLSRDKITQGLGLAKASRPAAIHFRS